MHSKVFKLLKETDNLRVFVALCKSPITTKIAWLSTIYFYWSDSPQGEDYWDALLGKSACFPTEDDIFYCKQHYPELFI